MYFSLPNDIDLMYIEYLRKLIPPPSQNMVVVCNSITKYQAEKACDKRQQNDNDDNDDDDGGGGVAIR
jgi:hypothetical protein